MLDLTKDFVELIRRTSTDLPPDVEAALVEARPPRAAGSAAAGALDTILENVDLARRESSARSARTPARPLFYCPASGRVEHTPAAEPDPPGGGRRHRRSPTCGRMPSTLSAARTAATTWATRPSRRFTSRRSDGEDSDRRADPQGRRLRERRRAVLACPTSDAAAGRDLEGVRRVVLDAVHQAQGQGCAPGILGVAIGGDRGSSFAASKEVLLRPLDDVIPKPDAGRARGPPRARGQPARHRPDGVRRRDDRAGRQGAPTCTGCRPASSCPFPTCAGPTGAAGWSCRATP